jgi:hypothetical protein
MDAIQVSHPKAKHARRLDFYAASGCLDDETGKDVLVGVFKRDSELVGGPGSATPTR